MNINKFVPEPLIVKRLIAELSKYQYFFADAILCEQFQLRILVGA
jgi:hypothetical protein